MARDSFESWSKDNDRWKEYIKLRSRKWEIKVERRGGGRYLGSEHLFCHPQDITTISHTNTSKQFTQTALLWIVCDINHLMLDKHWNNSRTNRALYFYSTVLQSHLAQIKSNVSSILFVITFKEVPQWFSNTKWNIKAPENKISWL